ncbi:MAG: hypothetical protein ACLQAT_18980 [Candidatus Binataceae bacterium]
MIPLVGFLPPTDPRVTGNVEAIRRELISSGLVMPYRSESNVDGLPPGEGVFLPCSFWLVDNLVMAGRRDEGEELFERLTSFSVRAFEVRTPQLAHEPDRRRVAILEIPPRFSIAR